MCMCWSQKHDSQASANTLHSFRCVGIYEHGRQGAGCRLRGCWGAAFGGLSYLLFLVPQLSLLPLHLSFEDLFPFLFFLPSFPSYLSRLFFFLAVLFLSLLFSCSHSLLFILSSPALSLLLSSPLLPHLFPSSPSPSTREPQRARSPGTHQHGLRVFLVPRAEGQGALPLQQVNGSELQPAVAVAAPVRALHGGTPGRLQGFPSAPILPYTQTPTKIRRLSSPKQPGAGVGVGFSMKGAGPLEGRIPPT